MENEEPLIFHKHDPVELLDGTWTQQITFELDGMIDVYEASGDDLEELERDWAYKYLELLGN